MEDRFAEALKHLNASGLGSFMSETANQIQLQALYRMRVHLDMQIAYLEAKGGFRNTDLDPFKILEVDINCTEEELRHAYRKKSQKAHPDLGGSDSEQRKVNAAYQAIRKFKGWSQ